MYKTICLIFDKIVLYALYAQTTRKHNIELFAIMSYIYCVLWRKRISVKPNVLVAYYERLKLPVSGPYGTLWSFGYVPWPWVTTSLDLIGAL